MNTILIVEDEADLARGLEINLKKEGFTTLRASTGQAGLTMAINENPRLILLDVMLPGMSGLDVCREIRRRGLDTPIIMLTARAEEVDRVVGLEIGADDYVTKPFSVRELIARIRVRLRRQGSAMPHVARYEFDAVVIDFEKHVATRNGRAMDLTPREFEILRLLVRRRGEVVTRDRLLDEVWGYDSSTTTRTVDTAIFKLRQKLEEDPANPRVILSIYGEGYKFVG